MTGGRATVVAVTLGVLVLLCAGMWRGWRARARRQADLPPLPAVPAQLGSVALDAVEGVYVGTTAAGDWLDRVVVHSLGRRSPAYVEVAAEGVLIERGPEPALFLAAGALVDARLDRALGGRVVEPGGLVVLTWQHGARRLDTGIRPRRATDAVQLRDAVARLASRGSAA
jgi:hypothetical protein